MNIPCSALTLITSTLVTFAAVAPAQPAPEALPLTTSTVSLATTSPLAAPRLSQRGPRIAPEAQGTLEQIRTAYAKLENLELTGTLSTDSEVAGRVEKTTKNLYGAFRSPARFIHRVDDELAAGSTGDKAYVFNIRGNQYLQSDAPSEVAPLRALPASIHGLLQSQNPSLLLALAKDPVQVLGSDAEEVTRAEDQKVDGKQYTALLFQMPQGRGLRTVLVDKETGLVRRVMLDMKPGLDRAGVAGVKSAAYIVDYHRIRPDAEFSADYFAWTPPAGAQEIPGGNAGTAEERSTTTVGGPGSGQ